VSAPSGLVEELELERIAVLELERRRAELWTAGRHAASIAAYHERVAASARVVELERRLAGGAAAGTGSTFRLAGQFVDDHWARGLPEAPGALSRLERRAGSVAVVELDAVGYDELLDDARYYVAEMRDAGFDGAGLIRSAERVVAALEKAGRPSS